MKNGIHPDGYIAKKKKTNADPIGVHSGNCRRRYRNLNPVMKKLARAFTETAGMPAWMRF